MILYLSILRLLWLFRSFYWSLKAEQGCSYQNGTDEANEMTFSSLLTLLVIYFDLTQILNIFLYLQFL